MTLVEASHSPRVIERMAEGMIEGTTEAVIEGTTATKSDTVIATPMMKSRSTMGRSSSVVGIGTSIFHEVQNP